MAETIESLLGDYGRVVDLPSGSVAVILNIPTEKQVAAEDILKPLLEGKGARFEGGQIYIDSATDATQHIKAQEAFVKAFSDPTEKEKLQAAVSQALDINPQRGNAMASPAPPVEQKPNVAEKPAPANAAAAPTADELRKAIQESNAASVKSIVEANPALVREKNVEGQTLYDEANKKYDEFLKNRGNDGVIDYKKFDALKDINTSMREAYDKTSPSVDNGKPAPVQSGASAATNSPQSAAPPPVEKAPPKPWSAMAMKPDTGEVTMAFDLQDGQGRQMQKLQIDPKEVKGLPVDPIARNAKIIELSDASPEVKAKLTEGFAQVAESRKNAAANIASNDSPQKPDATEKKPHGHEKPHAPEKHAHAHGHHDHKPHGSRMEQGLNRIKEKFNQAVEKASDIIDQKFGDKNGKLDSKDIQSFLEKVDKNHDGKVTPGELKTAATGLGMDAKAAARLVGAELQNYAQQHKVPVNPEQASTVSPASTPTVAAATTKQTTMGA